jgi:ribulose-phosphate 3-epimerase
MKVAPSILAADLGNVERELADVEKAGADYIHFDVMDGHYVPNLSFGPVLMESLMGRTSVPFDTHLMVENPDMYIEPFRRAGSHILTVQAEACLHLQRTLSCIRDSGMKAGAALCPATPLSVLEYVLGDLDLILIMTVNPGFSGQEYIRAMTSKIGDAGRMIRDSGLDIMLEVDGGINEITGPAAAMAGADILVAGSFIFNSKDYASAIRALRRKKRR